MADEYGMIVVDNKLFLKSPIRLNKLIYTALIIVTMILFSLSTIFITSFITENGNKYVTNNKQNNGNAINFSIIDNSFVLKNFEPLYINGKPGPITIDRNKDKRNKVNLYTMIRNSTEDAFDSFFLNGKNFSEMDETLEGGEFYICENNYRISKTGVQGQELLCPSFYYINIDKSFYGRFAKDNEHCLNDKKLGFSDNVKDFSLQFKNCGQDITELIKSKCDNHVSCFLRPSKETFKDTCPGIYKYLHTKYHCTKDSELKKPRIAVLMLVDKIKIKPNSIYEHAISEFYQYCNIHGYHLILNDSINDDEIDIYNMKLNIINEAIVNGLREKSYDWIFYVNCDILLANPNLKLEAFLPLNSNIKFIASSDEYGLKENVFFIKVSSWSLNFINRSIAYQFYNNTDILKFPNLSSMSNALNKREDENHYIIVPQNWFNANLENKKLGDFLINFSDRENKEDEVVKERNNIYKNMKWINAKTNKELRKEVLEYYDLPKEKQYNIQNYN